MLNELDLCVTYHLAAEEINFILQVNQWHGKQKRKIWSYKYLWTQLSSVTSFCISGAARYIKYMSLIDFYTPNWA